MFVGAALLALALSWLAFRIAWPPPNSGQGVSLWKEGKPSEAIEKLLPFARKGDRAALIVLHSIYSSDSHLDHTRAAIYALRVDCFSCAFGSRLYFNAKERLENPRLSSGRHGALEWVQLAAQLGYIPALECLSGMQSLCDSLEVKDRYYWKQLLSDLRR